MYRSGTHWATFHHGSHRKDASRVSHLCRFGLLQTGDLSCRLPATSLDTAIWKAATFSVSAQSPIHSLTCSGRFTANTDRTRKSGLCTDWRPHSQQSLVLGRCFDVIDDHGLDRSLRADEPEPELLLDRGIKIGCSVGIIAGARRITGAVALRFIGRPF